VRSDLRVGSRDFDVDVSAIGEVEIMIQQRSEYMTERCMAALNLTVFSGLL
jgi:hypothetical protein